MNSNWLDIGTYLPELTVSNRNIHEEIPEFSEDYSRDKLGIEERHIAGNESCVDMACNAVADLQNGGTYIDDADMLIVVTQTPDYPLPSMSCIIQNRLQLSTDTICFDINMGCSGYVYALSVAFAYLKSGLASKALIITSERYSRYINNEDYRNRGIFGDGATATAVTKDMVGHTGDFIFFTDGADYDAIIVPDAETGFRMDGQRVMGFAVKRIPRLVDRLLNSAAIGKEDIDHFIFHQGNQYMLKTIQHRLRIDDQNMVFSLRNSGNTVSSSIPLALAELIKGNRLNTGDRLLLCGFGVGLSASGVIITW